MRKFFKSPINNGRQRRQIFIYLKPWAWHRTVTLSVLIHHSGKLGPFWNAMECWIVVFDVRCEKMSSALLRSAPHDTRRIFEMQTTIWDSFHVKLWYYRTEYRKRELLKNEDNLQKSYSMLADYDDNVFGQPLTNSRYQVDKYAIFSSWPNTHSPPRCL